MNKHVSSEPLTPDALEAELRAVGPERYHDLHPFHDLLHGGKLNKGQVQAWALNRYSIRRRSRGRTLPSSAAATTGSCAANGCIASPTTTGPARTRAASSAGSL